MKAESAVPLMMGAQLFIGIWCILYGWLYRRNREPFTFRKQWRTTSGDFLLFLGGALGILFLLPLLLEPLMRRIWPEINPFAVGFGSIILLLIYMIFLWKRDIFSYGENLNSRKISPKKLLKICLFEYFWLTPLVFLTTGVWFLLLLQLQKWGWNISLNPQGLARALTETSSYFFMIFTSFVAIFLVPISEELLFRGGIYRYFNFSGNSLRAMILCSLLFAIMHWNALAFLPLFVFSLLLIRLYEKHQNLWVVMGVHGLFNGNSILLILLTRFLSQ